jgi:hypothetical protein
LTSGLAHTRLVDAASPAPDVRAPHVFGTPAWLSAWEHATIEETLSARYLCLDKGPAIPYYHVAASPFWSAYEVEGGVADVWPGPVVYSPSLYAGYGGGVAATGAFDTVVDEGLALLERCEAGALAFVNVDDREAREWIERRPPDEALVLDLAHSSPLAASLEEQLAPLRSHVRRELRRQWRRARERGVSLVVLREHEMRSRLPEFRRLASATSRRHSGDLYDLATFRALSEVPGATLLIAQRDGAMLGAFLCFGYASRFYLWTAGIDPASMRAFGTYAFLMVESIAHAIREGCEVLEVGRGNSAFKVRHGFAATKLWTLVYLGERWSADRALADRLAAMRLGLLQHLGTA